CFFFQAEDGIRDFHVTGVQTCALPIFIIFGALFLIVTKVASWRIMAGMVVGAILTSYILNIWDATPFMALTWYQHFLIGSFLFRSEERRVGKECKSRWWSNQ